MLEVLPSTHEDIRTRLEQAGYHHAIDAENGRIDMTGLALLPMRVQRMRSEAFALMGATKSLGGHTTMKSFRHYKGGTYTLLMVGRGSEERDELFAVYVSHVTQQIWVRPWTIFTELVAWPDGVIRPRFVEWDPNDPATTKRDGRE
jgi:hypothetical protein